MAADDRTLDQDLDVAGYSRSSFWQRTSAHIAELQSQLNRIRALNLDAPARQIADKADTHLRTARQAADRTKTLWSVLTGSDIDRAFANIHRAEAKILRLTPKEELAEWGPFVLATARQHLGREDARLKKLEERLKANGHRLNEDMRELAVTTLLAAHAAEELERARARSFRNILVASIVATGAIASLFVFWGFQDPAAIVRNICFEPNPGQMVCPIGGAPSGRDLLLVECFGAGAAAFAAAISLRNIQGTSTPYSVPLGLVVLRLPVGALAALMGLVLIHGGFIPGLSNLDSGPQIIAWAIIFGILQETVTRLVDRQGSAVLENVRGPERGFAR
ncbi:hypothetical protein JK361_27700 [Streptomyces sp. 5-8]|uniref:Uncharacterized protein n=1 Tax=Streptomyces musisoli TaxID=2802280 RepID=A0ABS1P7V1_9ACTN|nr:MULTISPECIES: hypothetical protein [Streptomyces]MBL1108329.1 hypothetical protein [Streptomyces musisoli]MBY8847149.1 hypothetical protein [Streptomyces sp. SP2-10]